MRNTIFIVSFKLLVIIIPLTIYSQIQTVGLFQNDSSSFNGYTLFAPAAYTNTYLINNDGLLVNMWQSNYTPAFSAYLLENGNLIRTATINNAYFSGGGAGGLIQEFDWEGTLLWDFNYSSYYYLQHHDIEKLPNGNVLVIAWEFKNFQEVLTAGRNPNLLSQNYLYPDHIVEVQPDSTGGGTIVWEWHVWDHLIQDFNPEKENYGVVSEHPELIDINYVRDNSNGTIADWNHINAIDYNESLDQILVTVLAFSEIWIIDHSTTTQEAVGHTGGNSGQGGDLIYRWGNPLTYKRGNSSNQKLFAPHDAHWIESGLPCENNILIFNNGRQRPGGNYSSIDEFVPPVDQNGNYTLNSDSTFGPDTLSWFYSAPVHTDFFAANLSSAQRLPNGNTLICDGPKGRFFEVTINKELVWLYINPVIASGPVSQGVPILNQQNRVFRTYRYTLDYPAFDNRDLTPGDPIEILPTTNIEYRWDFVPKNIQLSQNYPNPFNPITNIQFSIPKSEFVTLKIYNLLGQEVATLVLEKLNAGNYQYTWDAGSLASGVYLYRLQAVRGYIETRKMILIR